MINYQLGSQFCSVLSDCAFESRDDVKTLLGGIFKDTLTSEKLIKSRREKLLTQCAVQSAPLFQTKMSQQQLDGLPRNWCQKDES